MSYPLDHAVICVRDRMDAAADIYKRLGFTLTPRGQHRQGSINHLLMFPEDYLELIGFPPGGENLRPDLAEAPIGLDGLVFKSDDALATAEDLKRRGHPAGAPTLLSRPVEIDGRIEEARFATVRYPRGAVEGGRLYFCHHLTPQYVWRPEWLHHLNTANGVARFTIVVPDPAAEAARYMVILDTGFKTRTPSAIAIQTGAMELEFVTETALRERIGTLMPDPADLNGRLRASYMAMLTLRCADPARARAIVKRGGFDTAEIQRGTFAVAAADAMNCTLAFTGAAA